MIGYRRSSNKLIVSTSWLSMCYSSKSSAGTWLLQFNSSLAKLRIYYSMCWLRSEKMNWLLIRVALRGHRGETTHSLVISFNRGPFLSGTAGPGQAGVTESHRQNLTSNPGAFFSIQPKDWEIKHAVAIRSLDGSWERWWKSADELKAARLYEIS